MSGGGGGGQYSPRNILFYSICRFLGIIAERVILHTA